MIGQKLATQEGRIGTGIAWSIVLFCLLVGGWWGWRRIYRPKRVAPPEYTPARKPVVNAAEWEPQPIQPAMTVEENRPTPPGEESDPVELRIGLCGEDIQQLLALAEEYETNNQKASAQQVYRRIIAIDPDHGEAHKGLRHHNYDGKWFESYQELSLYRRGEAKRRLEKEGLVRFNDNWVPEGDLPYLRKGLIKNENGEWVEPTPEEDGGR